MGCSARRPDRTRRRGAPLPWRAAGAASALLAATLTVELEAWAQPQPGPVDSSEASAPEETQSADAVESPPTPESPVHPHDERLEDSVPPVAPADGDSDDDDPLDRLEPREQGAFPYPYPPAKELRPADEERPRARRRTHRPKPKRRWYGWQTLIADTLSIGAFYLAGDPVDDNETEERLMQIGAFGYFFGAPIVHWSNGQGGKGFASLLMRTVSAGAVVVGALNTPDESAAGGLLLVTGVTGLIAAIPIDAAALAYKDVPRRHRSQRAFDLAVASVTPIVDVTHRWLGLSATGRF